ncbi:MAG TPA: transposase, partial [Anaerovoracaceae bacterium]|nr:transposase [Anaerovoracaceae bacterium]
VDQDLLNVCYRKEWVIYCKPPFKNASCVVEYLGRYTHRAAISNNRILKLENDAVTFKWRDYRDSSRWKSMTLNAEEFIRRFLMHVLPHGFTKIRHYGFLSSRGKQKKLRICKRQTGTRPILKEKLSAEQLIQKLIGRKPSQCPQCGYSGLLKTGLSPPAA